MKAKDIIALANAGFSAQQIAALSASEENEPAEAPKPAPEAPAPAPTPAPAPAPAPTPAPDPVAEMLQKIGVALDNLQAANIQQSERPHELTADEVLAQVINPPLKK